MSRHDHDIQPSMINPDSLAPRLAQLGRMEEPDEAMLGYYAGIVHGWCPDCLIHALRHLAEDCAVAATVGTPEGEDVDAMLAEIITEFESPPEPD